MWPFTSKNETLEKLKDLEKSVHEIQNLSQSQKETFERQLTEIDKTLKEMKDPGDKKLEKYGKIIKSITSATAAIPKLMSGDPLQVTQGILDTVAAFAPLAGPEGEIVGLIASLFSGILGIFADQKKTDPLLVILQEIQKMFELYHREEIVEKINGTFEVMRHAHATMNGMEKSGKFTKDGFITLQTTVLDTIGVDCLGQVAAFMKYEIQNVKELQDAKNLLGIAQSYCQLSLFRLILLYQKYSICMKMKEEETALATKENIDQDRGQNRRDDLKEFYFPPSYDEALTASVLMQSDELVIKGYMEAVAVPEPPYPKPEEQTVGSEAFKDMPIKIKFTKDPKSIYWNIGTQHVTYQYPNGNASFEKIIPVDVAIILTQDKKCLLSLKDYPDCFLNRNYFMYSNMNQPITQSNADRILIAQFEKGDKTADFGFWRIDVMYEDQLVHPSEGIAPRERPDNSCLIL